MTAYEILVGNETEQSLEAINHIGGFPFMKIDEGIPKCYLCGLKMTFFFQVEFPETHDWHGKTMSMFCCTKCATMDYLIPKMPANLYEIPDGFLDEYQLNFKILVYPSKDGLALREDYKPVLKYSNLEFRKLRKNENSKKTKIGGRPYWRIEDNTPKSYMGSRFTFLMQIDDDWEFDKLENAPRQAQYAWFNRDNGYSEYDEYALFSGLPLYFFGTLDLEEPKVYVLNQK